MPYFAAPAMLSNGEISTDLSVVIDTIVDAYKLKTYREHPSVDEWGHSVTTRISRFRSHLIYELLTRMVGRDAQMQLLAGSAWSCRSKKSFMADSARANRS